MQTKMFFDFKALMAAAGAPTAQVMAERCGLNRKGVHNRIVRGIGWVEADELAVRCGFLPWEVWPEWADVTFEDADLGVDLDPTDDRCAGVGAPAAAA